MNNNNLAVNSKEFLLYVEEWLNSLKSLTIEEAMPTPETTAITTVDLTNGFCREGALASERVSATVDPIRDLFQASWNRGLRDIVFLFDNHEPDAFEFSAFPPHCVSGTEEAEPVDELKNLPFYSEITMIPKNSISSHLNTDLPNWIKKRPQLDTFIVVGDITDICTYQLAMYLKVSANAEQKNRRVIVPENCTQTYDLPVDIARQSNILPHDGDLLHAIFLYHMALNGVEVVKSIQ